MRILITGGAGFIGSHIADLLHSEGHEVRLLDALLPAAHAGSARPDYLGDYEFVQGDLGEPVVLRQALAGVDLVCHQAAMVGLETSVADMPDYVMHNDLGTARLLAAMAEAGIGRLVLASSMVVYGEGRYSCPEHGVVRPGPRTATDLDQGIFEPRCPRCGGLLEPGVVPEDAPLDPRNTYAATKLAQEHLAAVWARYTGSCAVGLRYHNVYGPRMPRNTPYAGVGSIFRSALARGEAPRVFEDGRQRRDFIHVRDIARANLLAMRQTSPGFSAYNVCSGHPHTIGDMARSLAESAGGPEPVVTGQYRLGDVRHIVADPGLARAELGFEAEVDFQQGMTEFGKAELRE
ncbi:NAD-dependent epimerase/dehydratase family protein [Saccharopolyspora shandongensis]|uniref:NAD-dependent epimerase/dehydratase family protein n=1 Tax=Saccharopolyspora shandongensis TaxID=418495 RepID=UPI00342E92F5